MINKPVVIIIVAISISLIMHKCVKDKPVNIDFINMEQLTEQDWLRLSEYRFLFGHQSVGYNIVEGIEVLKKEISPDLLIIKETKDPSNFAFPVFAHTQIGLNENPKSKIDDFAGLLRNGIADTIDIALMKFCYVDFNSQTDLNNIFEYYKETMHSLQKEFPDLKILHFTVPLTAKSVGIKALAKKILRRDRNIYINEYNKLIRDSFEQEYIFDLAKIESTYSNGTINVYGKEIQALIPEYTSDGGHLNQTGSIWVASNLLKKLAILP